MKRLRDMTVVDALRALVESADALATSSPDDEQRCINQVLEDCEIAQTVLAKSPKEATCIGCGDELAAVCANWSCEFYLGGLPSVSGVTTRHSNDPDHYRATK